MITRPATRPTFLMGFGAIAARALRQVAREPAEVLPILIVPIFFFAMSIAAFEKLADSALAIDFRAFELPVAAVFAVTSISRAQSLVTDIHSGYFDRICVTPINRLALLVGQVVADLVVMVGLTVPVLLVGSAFGVRFRTGPVGMLVFIAIVSLWGVAFSGFSYAIALRTGNPAMVASSFVLLFPFGFLTTAFLPMQMLEGWLAAAARVNPVTYLLEALRSLETSGWRPELLLHALVAITATATFNAVVVTVAFVQRSGRQ